MLRNHADFRFRENVHTDQIQHWEYLQQYEWWRPAGRAVCRINTLDDDHLENLKQHLYAQAFRYASEAGIHGLSSEALKGWIHAQPLYISILHELEERRKRAKKLQDLTTWSLSLPVRYFCELNGGLAFRDSGDEFMHRLYFYNNRLVWIKRTAYDLFDVVDFNTGQVVLKLHDDDDFSDLRTIKVC